MKPILIFILSSLFLCCSEDSRRVVNGEGFLNVKGGRIWYTVTGSEGNIPILLLHGGPGSTSYYLKPLAGLSSDRQVIMFDQLGCGRSDRITDTTLMTVETYVEHLNDLVNSLNVKEFYLYGHSWGTMLGMDYYLKYPEKVKAIIFAGPCLSAQLWLNDADSLITALPVSISKILRRSIQGVAQDSAKLASAVGSYMDAYYARRKPISADLDSANLYAGLNVYRHMWGESEFFATGTLKNYERRGDLGRIKVPVLYTVGEFDEVLPRTVKLYQALTPNSTLKIIPEAGHATMHDNPKEELRVISEFLEVVATISRRSD